MSDLPTILICTVGGSPAPILGSIRSERPAFVLLLCSAEGGPDGRGSRPEALHIAATTGLAADAYALAVVPADDPDTAAAICRTEVARLRRRFPSARLVCDYTGGTKSMSAALMLAGIAEPGSGIELRLMRGERRNLQQVADGTERPMHIAVDALLAERLLDRADLAWQSFGYAEAALLLEPSLVNAAAPEETRARLKAAHAASTLLAAWDRFDHAGALATWHTLPPSSQAALMPYAGPLACLADPVSREPLALLDLWHNACRRAARGQYDDAVGRCYRLMEWTAQWVLLTELGLRTDAVTRETIGPELFAKFARGADREALKIGLEQAIETVRQLLPDHPLSRELGPKGKSTSALKALNAWKERRNRSILAHGFEPIGTTGWQEVQGWLEAHWLPWLDAELAEHGLALLQLPQALLRSLDCR